MIRAVISVLVALAFVACGGDGPKRTKADLYSIRATVADPSRGTITISISVASNPSERDVKEAAEAVIATYRAEYPSITVKSYPMSADGSGLPYGTSVLEGGVISHSFNPQSASEKIKTH
jgi:ABC-type glycerol-3-phosphate transport system substrate-binding protein